MLHSRRQPESEGGRCWRAEPDAAGSGSLRTVVVRSSLRLPGTPPLTRANADRRASVGTGVRTPRGRSGSIGADRPAAPAVDGANRVSSAGTGATVCAVVGKFGGYDERTRGRCFALPPIVQALGRFLYASGASERIPYRQRRMPTANMSMARIDRAPAALLASAGARAKLPGHANIAFIRVPNRHHSTRSTPVNDANRPKRPKQGDPMLTDVMEGQAPAR